MSLRVFVASSFGNRHQVREVHEQLKERGMTPTSSWCYAELPDGRKSDWFFELPAEEQRRIVKQNDDDLRTACAMLFLADADGRESYAEAARALFYSVPIVWTGKKTTSIVREGVAYVPTLTEAILLLEDIHRARVWLPSFAWNRVCAHAARGREAA